MFTCKKIRDGSTYLSTHLSANDYYCNQEQVSGIWVGKGAERLGIAGQAIGKDDWAFEALRLNQHPEGSGKLTPRNVANSVRFFDFQCAPQKSVSIMAVMMEDHRLCDAHNRASRAALAELERFAAIQTGQGRRKHFETTGNLCAAAFRHDASRELDPQLHTHFVIANASWDSGSQRWLALQTHDMFKAIRYCGKVYQNELARQCRDLGYEIEMVREAKGMVEGFQIKGVSQELQLRYSKRRAEVEAAIDKFVAERGRQPNPAEISQLASETRSPKLREINTPAVRQYQRCQLSPSELIALKSLKRQALIRSLAQTHSMEPTELRMESNWRALMQARDHLYERHSVLKGHQILAEALNQNLGGIDLQGLKHCLTSPSTGMTRLVESHRNPLLSCQWASNRGLELERWSVEFVNQTQLKRSGSTSFSYPDSDSRPTRLDHPTESRSWQLQTRYTLTRRAGRFEPGQSLVVEPVEPGRLYFQNSSEPLDPAKHADKLLVATTRQIELASGDPILIRRNARKLGLVNGEILTCGNIQSDGSIHTREGKILPPTFRDFCHGYVVTSHKSQGRTHDQVIVAAQRLDAKAAYVACSRGRHQAFIFTPDKARLFEGVEQSGDRLAASDVLDPIALRPAIWRQLEQRAWQKAVEQASLLQRITERPEPTIEREPEIRLPSKKIQWREVRLPSSELEISL